MRHPVRLHETPPGLAQDIARLDELWGEGLSRFGGPFLGGEAFAAVDAFFCRWLSGCRPTAWSRSRRPVALCAALLALPAMREWEAAALAETWREPGHEAEAKAAGVWVEDRRAVG